MGAGAAGDIPELEKTPQRISARAKPMSGQSVHGDTQPTASGSGTGPNSIGSPSSQPGSPASRESIEQISRKRKDKAAPTPPPSQRSLDHGSSQSTAAVTIPLRGNRATRAANKGKEK